MIEQKHHYEKLHNIKIVSLWYTFGGGTKLVVKSGPTVKPSVSLLPPSSLQISGDSAALLCLLSSYSPQGALVSWTLDGSEVTDGVQTSAESERGGRYSRSSVLTLSKASWEKGELYVCRVTHDGAPQEVSFQKNVTLAPPTHSDCYFASRTASPILHRSDCVSPRDQSGIL
ncbi:Immunoglobulin lambda-like polypeptide 5 [Labeo rohita]|nr:Immunoglobulin lambda-like polypeptide 5 [Labeo rohita]